MHLKTLFVGDKDSSLIRKVFHVNFATILFGTVVSISGMVVDGIVISRFLGERATAAYGVAMCMMLLLSVFSGILSSGGQTLVGQALGTGDVEEANRLVTVIHKCVLIISGTLVVATFLFQTPILNLLGMPESAGDLHLMCRDYLIGLMIGFPGILWASTMPMFLPLDSDPMRTFISVVVGTAVNIAGDLLNVFVFHGGMFGMALATSISYYVNTIIILPHFLDKKYCLRLWTPGSGFKGIAETVKDGIPTGLTRGMQALRSIILNRILLMIGTTSSLAAFTVGRNSSDYYSSLRLGLGMVVLMLTSAFMKESDQRTLEQILKTMLFYCFVPFVLVTVLILMLSEVITGVYLPADSEAYAPALICVICMALALPLNSLNTSMANYLQGVGRIFAATVFSILDSGGMLVVCAIILGQIFGVSGVWYAFPVCEIVVLLIYFVYAAVHRKHFPRNISDFLFLKEDSDTPDEDQLDRTIDSLDQVVACSKDVHQFCLSKNAGSRNSNVMALSVEELCNNIIQWGFADGKKHSINVRIACKNENLTLRIRDDCKAFDPKKQAEMYRAETGMKNIGLRLIYGMVQEMRYVNMLRLNILFIELKLQKGDKK